MDEFENKNTGELDGFDEVNTSDAGGYTVTPNGSFYTKSKDEIIQDEVVKPVTEEKTASEPLNQEAKQSSNNYSYNPYSYTPPMKPKKTKKPKQKRTYSSGIVILASLLAAVIGSVCSIAVAGVVFSVDQSSTNVVESNDNSATTNNVNINVDKTVESVVEAVAEKVTPSVVGIRTTTSVMNFFGGSSEASGEGSGVVYTKDGYIITNYHVVSDAVSNGTSSKIEVFLDSSESDAHSATIVGYNISADIAVIKINAKNLTAVEFANSDELKVGQYVITVGNPGGLEFMDSVTYGVISGLNRVVSADSGIELIQTDAAINPGNSGGALVNTKGQLVGINSAKIVSEEFEGMGFAIPSNTVDKLCKKIIENQNSPEPYIGISISERYTANVLKELGFPVGAVVLSVADGSPAEASGIEKGDIVTEYDGKEITEYTVLEQLMEKSVPNQSVSVKIYRRGRYYTTTIKVGANNQVD